MAPDRYAPLVQGPTGLDHQVGVVGAGPTGLLVAAELATAGVRRRRAGPARGAGPDDQGRFHQRRDGRDPGPARPPPGRAGRAAAIRGGAEGVRRRERSRAAAGRWHGRGRRGPPVPEHRALRRDVLPPGPGRPERPGDRRPPGRGGLGDGAAERGRVAARRARGGARGRGRARHRGDRDGPRARRRGGRDGRAAVDQPRPAPGRLGRGRRRRPQPASAGWPGSTSSAPTRRSPATRRSPTWKASPRAGPRLDPHPHRRLQLRARPGRILTVQFTGAPDRALRDQPVDRRASSRPASGWSPVQDITVRAIHGARDPLDRQRPPGHDLPRRPGAAGRRRRPRPLPVQRPGTEPRRGRRDQPRLEARRHRQRLGARGPARHLHEPNGTRSAPRSSTGPAPRSRSCAATRRRSSCAASCSRTCCRTSRPPRTWSSPPPASRSATTSPSRRVRVRQPRARARRPARRRRAAVGRQPARRPLPHRPVRPARPPRRSARVGRGRLVRAGDERRRGRGRRRLPRRSTGRVTGLLVRPDGVIAWATEGTDADATVAGLTVALESVGRPGPGPSGGNRVTWRPRTP